MQQSDTVLVFEHGRAARYNEYMPMSRSSWDTPMLLIVTRPLGDLHLHIETEMDSDTYIMRSQRLGLRDPYTGANNILALIPSHPDFFGCRSGTSEVVYYSRVPAAPIEPDSRFRLGTQI